jgi:hypothetical protein
VSYIVSKLTGNNRGITTDNQGGWRSKCATFRYRTRDCAQYGRE